MTARIVVVGDVVLDRDVEGTSHRLCPDAPVPVVDTTRIVGGPGGAGLAALLCREGLPGGQVRLIAPLADDDAGRQARSGLAGIDVVSLGHEGPTRRKTRVRVAGQSLVRVDDGGPGRPAGVDEAALDAALAEADVILVADYGAGTMQHPVVREHLTRAAARGRVVWDPHPRGGDPVPGVALATPNEAEARGVLGDPLGDPSVLAEDVRAVWAAQAVAVTVGARGAVVAGGGSTTHVPARPVTGLVDTCGAGDAFAAAAAVALADGDDAVGAVTRATQVAGRWIADGGIAAFRDRIEAHTPRGRSPGTPPGAASAEALAARMRTTGGTLVATGGCFDVLHSGHLSTLEAARSLGDGLVVLVNSDDSVRRLKGPDRPAVPEQERARMLAALRCVDAVQIFDDDTPVPALERLRPQVWVKGGDYAVDELPEAVPVRSWGGRVVLVPYVAGRSTSALLSRAAHG